MANNCLVTKLKGVVQNDNLPKLGELAIEVRHLSSVDPGNPSYMVIGATGDSITVKSKGGAYLSLVQGEEVTNPVDTIVVASGETKNIWCANADYTIILDKKYGNIRALGLYTDLFKAESVKDCSYSQDLQELYFNGGNTTPGNLSDLIGHQNLHSIQAWSNPNFGGDLSLVASINPNALYYFFNNSAVHGTIEGFVEAMIAAGRDNSGMQLGFNETDAITFGGLHFTAYHVQWNTTAKIYCFNDTNPATANTVWAKGATAEEIATWQQAGKTVIVVS